MEAIDLNALFVSAGGAFTAAAAGIGAYQAWRAKREAKQVKDGHAEVRVLVNGRMTALMRHNAQLIELCARHGLPIPPIPEEDSHS